jgi:cobalt-zinc-cadmium efflux system protein
MQRIPERHSPARELGVALAITTGFFVIEVVGGLLTGSLALLADAGHMLTDVAALSLALFALWISRRPVSARRSYGYYRIEILAALVNGVALVLIAFYIFWEAIERLQHPPEVQSLPMLAVAGLGLLANLATLGILGHESHANLNVRAAVLHILGDLFGSVGALGAGALMFLTGWYLADPLLSIAIGALILWSAWGLVVESVDILLEATPRHIDASEVADALASVEGVIEVHDLHIWTLTSGYLALSAHAVVPDYSRAEQVLRELAALLHDRYGIEHATIQIEVPGAHPELRHAPIAHRAHLRR